MTLRDALMDEIERKSDEVDKLMSELLAEMEAVPPGQREGPAWGPDGSYTKRFLTLVRRRSEISARLLAASGAIDRLDESQPS